MGMLKNGSWAMRINWAEPALEDLEAIQAYIAKDSSFYARQFIERIFDAATKLESFPEIGRRVPEAEERTDIRELIFQGYRIIYLMRHAACLDRCFPVSAVLTGFRNQAAYLEN